MAKKLKTYQTSLGFFDEAIAAPSMKAALEAWGADSNLFHQGAAKESDDPAVIAATMASNLQRHDPPQRRRTMDPDSFMTAIGHDGMLSTLPPHLSTACRPNCWAADAVIEDGLGRAHPDWPKTEFSTIAR